jgi:enterochelin esterase-like enzyme
VRAIFTAGRAGLLAAFALVLLAREARAEEPAPRIEEVPSRLTKGPVPVTVLLPPSYEFAKDRRYPVLYFLHDGFGDERALFRYGVAERLLMNEKAGAIPELIVVSPRVAGTWCVDSYDGKRRTASFLEEELVPFIEARYRTVEDRRSRAVAGISMGGYGAVRWAVAHPERFTAVAALSPALQQMSWETLSPLPFLVRKSFTSVFGESELKNNFRQNDVYDLLLRDPALGARLPYVSLRAGTEDRYRLAQVIRFFGRFLDALGVPNKVTVEPGAHDWKYWSHALPPLLAEVATRLWNGRS